MSSDAKDCAALRVGYEKSVQELVRDVSHFLYFCDLDQTLTQQLGTIRDLLLQLGILNNIAVERLLELLDEGDLEILVILLRRGDIEIANVLKAAGKLLLEEKVDIESRNNVARRLLSVIPENGPEVVMRQLHPEKGTNTNLKDWAGQTPLTWDVTNGHKAVLQLLLDKGAGIESKSRPGQTLMSWDAQKDC
ncbi:hypothetical protein Neosp_014969 [[Neocosmospora] mangrovei]